jgi:hypothetical protein
MATSNGLQGYGAALKAHWYSKSREKKIIVWGLSDIKELVVCLLRQILCCRRNLCDYLHECGWLYPAGRGLCAHALHAQVICSVSEKNSELWQYRLQQ